MGVSPISGDCPNAAFARRRALSRCASTGVPAGGELCQNISRSVSGRARVVQRRLVVDAVAYVRRRRAARGGNQRLLARGDGSARLRQRRVGGQRRLGLLTLSHFLRTGSAGPRRTQSKIGRHRQRRARRHLELVRRVAGQAEGAGQFVAAARREAQAASRHKNNPVCLHDAGLTAERPAPASGFAAAIRPAPAPRRRRRSPHPPH